MSRPVVVGLCALAVCSLVLTSCSRSDGGSGSAHNAAAPSAPALLPPAQPNFYAGPPDDSRAVVMRHPEVQLALPSLSAPFRDIPNGPPPEEKFEREPRRSPPFANALGPDPVLQTAFAPVSPLIMTVHSFLGQGETLGGCIFPRPDMGEPAGCTTTGDPPDTNGAVGLNHYVQTVNGGVAIWDKSGALLMTPKYLNTLWAGYVGTNTGNACATENDGDPVVLYDQLADRWFLTQFSLPNYSTNKGPSFQCVAVSKTGDPTGAYYLYDFQYSALINDYGKFGVWPDAYFASFNNFSAVISQGANVCAYDRVAMLQGKPAAQHCFQQAKSVFGLLPSSVDGAIKPPNGEPGFFVTLSSGTSIDLYKLHADFVTPTNSTFTGPTTLPVAAYSELCNGSSCVKQPSPGNALASLGDRPMFHLSYRNFGTVESLLFNHSITAGSSGAPRWYEIRSPNGTPVVFQQGTYAPDTRFRWMGSIAQDQAQDIALGYSISSSTQLPSIAWTGRTATDAAGTMGQAETLVQSGAGVETGTFSDGSTASRWGDYSNMSVDPSDDCTFWYTTERYPSNGVFNWDTGIASAKFDNCGKNDFSIALTPASDSVAQSGQVTFTVTTAATKGTAESITLVVEDLPTGVTGVFAPASVTAGASSTLTLTATATAPVTAAAAPFMVIGKAASAVHAATAMLSVVACKKLTMCPSPDDCGTLPDGCGGTVSCGPACTAPKTCGGGGMANVCGCTPTMMCPAGANCGSVDNGCGVMVSCGAGCTGGQTCVANVCVAPPADLSPPPDLSAPADLATPATPDLATAAGADLSIADSGDLATGSGGGGGGGAGGAGGGGGSGGKGGCGCRVGGQPNREGPISFALVVLGLGLALVRRRAQRISL